MRIASWVGWSVALVAGVVAAKETPAEGRAKALLADVVAATKGKDGDKGSKAVVDLAALATKEKSLSIEERAAEAFEDLLDALDDAPAGGTAANVGKREAMARVMKALDAARHGVFLSAHALANELVLRSVAAGDAAHLDDALQVLTAYAATPKCGKAGPAMLKLAQGVKAARAGEAKAAEALEAAATALREGRWTRPILACALERVVLRMNASDPAGAAKVAEEAVAGLTPEQDGALALSWSAVVKHRVPDLPPAVAAALDAALAPLTKGGGAAGAAGGRGGNATEGPSPLGKAWPRIAADKAFVTVKRTDKGYEVHVAYDKSLAYTQPFQGGQRVWDKDGLTLEFVDGGAAVRMLDMVGNRGQPGERTEASPAFAFYLLAPGETLGTSMNGAIVS